MGKTLNYIQEEATGRLVYRRIYPADVRPFLPQPKSVFKVPLGAKRVMTPEAFRAYHQLNAQFDQEVKRARVAKLRHAKEAEGLRDTLTPELVKHIADLFAHQEFARVEEALRVRGGDWADRALAGWEWHLDEFQRWRAEGDLEAMDDHWGRTADALLHEEGIIADPDDPEGRERLLWAINDAALRMSGPAKRQLVGHPVDIPDRPPRPANPKGRARTVSALLDAYKAYKWEAWSPSSRKAVEPVLRVLRETIGDRKVESINRDDARDVLETVKSLPVNLGKRADLRGLSVPSAIARGRELNLQTLGPGTINKGYMVHISSIFNFAVDEEWTAKNPFVGLGVHDPVSKQDKRDPFTTDQLRALFTSAPWDAAAAMGTSKPGAFWAPLAALYMGARLGEIAGLRLMDVAELEGIPALHIRPYEGHTVKNDGSRRVVPIHPALIQLGLLTFVEHRRTESEPAALLFPDGKPNSRQQSGAKLGERFSGLLKARGIVGNKLGMHSFRHNFEDRLKPVGLHGTSVGRALTGRAVPGSEGGYGNAFTLPVLLEALEKVTYPGLDLSHLELKN